MTLIFPAVLAFIFGITIGSFLNVVIYRVPQGMSLSAPPSHCTNCKRRLTPLDLVPLFSYIFLGGKCRTCKVKISPRYFIIEFITGLIFAGLVYSTNALFPGFGLDSATATYFILHATFLSCLLVIFMIDLDTFLVFLPICLIALGAGIIAELIRVNALIIPFDFSIGGFHMPAFIPGAIVGFFIFIGMDALGRLIFKKPSMGMGDAFIGMAIGGFLGIYPALLSFMFAIVLGGIIGGILYACGGIKKRKAPKDEDEKEKKDDDDEPEGIYMPFGPFLALAAAIISFNPPYFMNLWATFWNWWMYSNPFLG